MPKTGTSSIQESLHYGLTDPTFRYIGLGGINSGPAIATLFGDAPETHHSHRKMGRLPQQAQRYRMQWLNQVGNILANTGADVRQGAIPLEGLALLTNAQVFFVASDLQAYNRFSFELIGPFDMGTTAMSYTERVQHLMDQYIAHQRQQ